MIDIIDLVRAGNYVNISFKEGKYVIAAFDNKTKQGHIVKHKDLIIGFGKLAHKMEKL